MLVYDGDAVKQYDESAGEQNGADGKREEFRRDLEALINRHSRENGSNTPDFILAEYLTECLSLFDSIVNRREKWYGREPENLTRGIITEAGMVIRPPMSTEDLDLCDEPRPGDGK